LADAAARHQDVFLALQIKSQLADLARRESELRIRKHLMDTSYSGWRDRNASGATSTPAQAVVSEQTDPDRDEDIGFRRHPMEVQHILVEKYKQLNHQGQLANVGVATERITKLFCKTASVVKPSSPYLMKVAALLALFRIAEILTESPGEFATRIRDNTVARRVSDTTLKVSQCFNTKQVVSFVQDKGYMEYLGDIFGDSIRRGTSIVLINQIKFVISDLKRRALVIETTELQGNS
jgi:hypothetical protein